MKPQMNADDQAFAFIRVSFIECNALGHCTNALAASMRCNAKAHCTYGLKGKSLPWDNH